MIKILLAAITALAAFLGLAHKDKKERNAFNKGICPTCNSELKLSSTDEKLGRIYKCPACGYKTSVKWIADKNYEYK